MYFLLWNEKKKKSVIHAGYGNGIMWASLLDICWVVLERKHSSGYSSNWKNVEIGYHLILSLSNLITCISNTHCLTKESIHVTMLCTMGCRIQVGRADTVTKAKLEYHHFWVWGMFLFWPRIDLNDRSRSCFTFEATYFCPSSS